MHTLRSYIIGFVLSILFTVIAPALLWWHEATQHVFPTHTELRIAFVALALLQLVVQLVFFLHISREREQRWNVAALAFALCVVAILVGGTLWIMYNLQQGQMLQMDTNFIGGQITPQAEND